jgi:hypothetical protein
MLRLPAAVISQYFKGVVIATPETRRISKTTVCLYQPGGIHYADGPDNAGTASFDFELNSTEDIKITVWKPGYVTYTGVITVEE